MDKRTVLLIIVSLTLAFAAIACDSMPTTAPAAAMPTPAPYWEMTPTSIQAELRELTKTIAQNCFQRQGKLLVPETKGCNANSVTVKEMTLAPSAETGFGPPYVKWLALGQATIGNKTRPFAWQANFVDEGTGFELTSYVFAWTDE